MHVSEAKMESNINKKNYISYEKNIVNFSIAFGGFYNHDS